MHSAALHLLSHRTAEVAADGAHVTVRFVIDPGTGEIVFPAPGWVIEAEEVVLHVPGEAPAEGRELQLLVRHRQVGESAVTDRWSGYHGPPGHPFFVSCVIESAKMEGQVVDGAEMSIVNSVRDAEGSLRRWANSDKARLRAAVATNASVQVADPVVVGVDSYGVDVRAAFGIVRLSFDREAADGADARTCLENLLGAGR